MQASIRFNRTVASAMVSAIATTTAILPLAMPTLASEPEFEPIATQEGTVQIAQWITPDAGSISADSYHNEYFGFTISFPEGWAIASQEAQDQVMDLGTDVLAANNPELAEAATASLASTYQLLMISEQPLGSPDVTFNPSLMVMAENVTAAPHIITGADYLRELQTSLAQSGLPYRSIGNIYAVELDGRTFYRSDYVLGDAIKQSYLATVDQGYTIGMILSGLPQQFEVLDGIVNSTSFDN
ncbi:MAG: hypothetical protein AAGD25_30105 [Cyanobacteria bacterium P01_F01_bin.150]